MGVKHTIEHHGPPPAPHLTAPFLTVESKLSAPDQAEFLGWASADEVRQVGRVAGVSRHVSSRYFTAGHIVARLHCWNGNAGEKDVIDAMLFEPDHNRHLGFRAVAMWRLLYDCTRGLYLHSQWPPKMPPTRRQRPKGLPFVGPASAYLLSKGKIKVL